VLRGIFAFEYSGARALHNPVAGIKNFKRVKTIIDPLTRDERDLILADMRQHYDERVVAYFQWAFYTGMRPEEIIALRWGDIDFGGGTARVQRVRTFRGHERAGTKTDTERDVDLVPDAIAALQMMKPHTFMRGVDADIFANPVTGRPWHDERSQREIYWNPCLRRAGVRHRTPYHTRHTYATTALMAGVPPAYISAQMGHVDSEQLHKTYAKWIHGGDAGRARAMLEAAMAGSQSTPAVPRAVNAGNDEADKSVSPLDLSAFKNGRRDWTRTNDPHHVKVVL
jgi:integrase